MFYDTASNRHGLKHDPFKALIVPRPIGWISTRSRDGVLNLAPYSFFNAVREKPPYVMFSSDGRKDSQRNAEETGEFVCSLVSEPLWAAMSATAASVPPEIDEFALAGLETAPSTLVGPPRVKASPAAFECRYWRTIALPGADVAGLDYAMVIGEVVGIYIDDAFVRAGAVDTAAMRPMARLGYQDYTVVERAMTLVRPG